jgi:hypothetical protein
LTRDHKRFAQLVRKLIRQHVQKEREAPAFSLWVSDAGDQRAAAVFHVGAAQSANEVRVETRRLIELAGAHYCAIGRLLHDTSGDAPEPTSLFGLIVFARGADPIGRVVDIVAGRIGSWQEWDVDGAGFEFVQAALEAVAKRETEDLT